MRRPDRQHVVIAGGGVAALETVLAIRALAGHAVDITMLAPAREFVYRPVTVAEAFDVAEARTYDVAEILADQGSAELVHDMLGAVDPVARVAIAASGRRIPFDALVIATGAVPGEGVPRALTFRGRADVPALRGVLHDLIEGDARSVAFALPSESVWPMPLYELALMTATHLREHGADDAKVTVVTPED